LIVKKRSKVEEMWYEIRALESAFMQDRTTLKSPEQFEADKLKAVTLKEERQKLSAEISQKKKAVREKLMVHASNVMQLMYRSDSGPITISPEERFALYVAWSVLFDTKNAGLIRSIRYVKKQVATR
jgi:hypothetical protein